MSAEQLNQSPQSMSIQEGEDVSMNCNSSSMLNLLLWYKQDATCTIRCSKPNDTGDVFREKMWHGVDSPEWENYSAGPRGFEAAVT